MAIRPYTDARRKINKAYRIRNKEKYKDMRRVSDKRYRQKHRVRLLLKHRTNAATYRLRNLEAIKAKRKLYTQLLKSAAITAYGGRCDCCKEDRVEFLCVDHVNGGGNKERKQLKIKGGAEFYRHLRKLKYPKKVYRVLCCNCNHAISVYGECPHGRTSA